MRFFLFLLLSVSFRRDEVFNYLPGEMLRNTVGRIACFYLFLQGLKGMSLFVTDMYPISCLIRVTVFFMNSLKLL